MYLLFINKQYYTCCSFTISLHAYYKKLLLLLVFVHAAADAFTTGGDISNFTVVVVVLAQLMFRLIPWAGKSLSSASA